MHLKSLGIFIIFAALLEDIFAREQWVDPHEMFIRTRPGRKEKHDTQNDDGFNSCNCDLNFYRDKSSSHLKKIISLLTEMAYFDRRSAVYKGIIDIHLQSDDYDFLKKYISAESNEDHVSRQLIDILEKSIGKSFYSSHFFSIGETLYMLICNEHIQLCVGLVSILYFLWRVQPHNYKLTTLFKLFFPLVYISDFYLRYKAKLEEVEIDQYIQYESHSNCDPDRLSWFDWVYDKFTGSCKQSKRQFLLSQRAATHIFTPLHVIGDQFDIFVTIFKHLGSGLGNFMWAFIENVPWYLKLFFGLLSFILVIILLLMMGSFFFGINPKFNLFHMIQFEFLHKDSNEVSARNQTSQDCISGENLKNLLRSYSQDRTTMIAGSSCQKKNSVPNFKPKAKLTNKRRFSDMHGNSKKSLAISQQNTGDS